MISDRKVIMLFHAATTNARDMRGGSPLSLPGL